MTVLPRHCLDETAWWCHCPRYHCHHPVLTDTRAPPGGGADTFPRQRTAAEADEARSAGRLQQTEADVSLSDGQQQRPLKLLVAGVVGEAQLVETEGHRRNGDADLVYMSN